MLTEEDFERDVEIAKRVLKQVYVDNIVYMQERMSDKAEEEELKSIEEVILSNERMIVYFDKGDEWVKNLHEEAQRKSDNGGGIQDVELQSIEVDPEKIEEEFEDEIARIEAARNS